MFWKMLAPLACLPLLAQNAGQTAAADLRARIEASPTLPFEAAHFAAQAPGPGWESGMVLWIAIDPKGPIYELQRGDKADPVLVLDRDGKILRRLIALIREVGVFENNYLEVRDQFRTDGKQQVEHPPHLGEVCV